MIARYEYLQQHPAVFLAMTGLRVAEFDKLLDDVLPRLRAAEVARLGRPDRRRALGAGHPFALAARDQVLLAVVWLRMYPTHPVLGYLFGVSRGTVDRALPRLVPVLEAAGLDTMRRAREDLGRPRRPGQRSRRHLGELLRDVPGLAVVIDTFEQRIERPQGRQPDGRRVADAFYSGKKKQHTRKTQVAVDADRGRIVDVPASVPGPTNDLRLLAQSGTLDRLPPEVGVGGDLAYVGVDTLAPARPTGTPRRKPRGRPRPAEDAAYNTAFASWRVIGEHSIGRLRRYQCLTQTDRHGGRAHTRRTRAVAGLANHQLRHRFPC